MNKFLTHNIVYIVLIFLGLNFTTIQAQNSSLINSTKDDTISNIDSSAVDSTIIADSLKSDISDSSILDSLKSSISDSSILNPLKNIEIDSLASDSTVQDSLRKTLIDSLAADSSLLDINNDSLASDSTMLDSIKALPSYEIEIDTNYFSIFFEVGAQFVNFQSRDLFIENFQQKYSALYEQAETPEERTIVSGQIQDYTKANISLPFGAGLTWHFAQNHYLSIAANYIFNKESAILSDRYGKTYHQYYVLQIIPAYLEYKFLIPEKIASINDQNDFFITTKWFWLLPGTEIYTNNGVTYNQFSKFGNGLGFYIGYVVNRYNNFSISGSLGYSVIKAKSNEKWTDIIPSTLEEGKVKWNVGGLSLNIKINFHFKKYPLPDAYKPEEFREGYFNNKGSIKKDQLPSSTTKVLKPSKSSKINVDNLD